MPDPGRSREVLEALERAAPRAVVLWRGASLDGGDVDLVTAPGREQAVADALAALGLSPFPERPGEVEWRLGPAHARAVVLDVRAPWAWPAHCPPLAEVLAGATPSGPGGVLVALPEHRLACFGAEAVAGRPLAKLRAKAAAALAEGASPSDALARLAARLPASGDVLPPGAAVRAALRSRRGRAALRVRALGHPLALPPTAPGARRGRLVTVSGLDGAGKSSAGLALASALGRDGHPAIVTWSRLAAEHGALHRVATLVRRVLGRPLGATSAVDPTRAVDERLETPGTASADGVVAPVWAVLVALAYVRHCRRLVRARRRGVDVVCDRWTADAVVDLRLRYGRRPLAERLLRLGMPRADLAVLLDVSPEVAAARKPGDQDEASLRDMAELYAELARRVPLVRVDAEQPPADVREHLARLVAAAR